MEQKLFEGEEIKNVKGYEGLYAITSFGRVWSYPKNGRGGHNGKWLKAIINNRGYLSVVLCKNNKYINKLIHRLVAEAFIENPNNYPTVDHIDRNKLNNKKENLRWATILMQNNNRVTDISKAIEATKKKVRCIETNITYESVRESSRQTGIHNENISAVCLGKQKTAGGYHWEFVKGEAE